MQSLDIISVNLWQILISFANLAILFFLFKKFLFAPVKKIFAQRQDELRLRYDAANDAQEQAERSKNEWENKRQGAQAEADAILARAAENAKIRADKIVAEAKENADGLIRRAQAEAELERKRAEEDIKREIVELSGALTEKMLEREIHTEDHRSLIDSFIKEIEENDGRDQ